MCFHKFFLADAKIPAGYRGITIYKETSLPIKTTNSR